MFSDIHDLLQLKFIYLMRAPFIKSFSYIKVSVNRQSFDICIFSDFFIVLISDVNQKIR